jgi:hypothetical protein
MWSRILRRSCYCADAELDNALYFESRAGTCGYPHRCEFLKGKYRTIESATNVSFRLGLTVLLHLGRKEA